MSLLAPLACSETENSGSEATDEGSSTSGGTTSTGSTGSDGGSAGAPSDGIPADCEMLAETNPSLPCVAGERCEQVKTEDVPRTFTLFVDDTGTDEDGNDVPYTEQEMSERIDCLQRWLEQLGLESSVVSEDVEVTATFEKLEPVLATAALAAYTVGCVEHDCDYCFDYDEAACAADAFCLQYRGQPLDEARECLGEVAFAGCLGHDDYCAQAPSYARDAAGQCWSFTSYCYDSPYLPIDETCHDSNADPPPACL